MSIEKPTEDDFARDLAADLAIQKAATDGPWIARARRGYPATVSLINPRASEYIFEVSAFGRADVAQRNARAIANAGTNAQSWLRRTIAAEEAILEWNESSAALADAPEGTTPATREALRRYDSAIGSMRSLAARIREGRRP